MKLLDEDGEPGRLSTLPECRCVDLTLADGTVTGCGGGGGSCLVAESPCVAIGANGEVERSAPVKELNGLIHKSELLCRNNAALGGIIRK